MLLAEFLLLSFFRLYPYIGPAPTAPEYVITYQNASRWIITAENPLGQLTSFVVFDGWSNILNLLLAVFIISVLTGFTDRGSAWFLGLGLFITTNLAGLLSPSAIYLGSPSNYGSWGMSSATFAPVGFAIVGCIWVLWAISKPKPPPKIGLSAALLGLFVILGVVMSLGMIGQTITWDAFHVHLLSSIMGGLSAVLVLRRLQSRARASGRVPFQPLESHFSKNRTA